MRSKLAPTVSRRFSGAAFTLTVAFTLTTALVLSVAGECLAKGFIEFRGQRYYPTLGGMQGEVGIGFDPVNNQVLSVAETDVCGNLVANRAGNNGVSWDPINQEFWMINANRQVYTFDANNDPAVIFEIPQTFNVPGVGSQTLHSPQGLAVDMNHVYVVDFGPNIGETNSNQWFKFMRDGTPVASSASTDFNARLQDHTDSFGDATVDGIVWIPPGSPMDSGLFYVAVEHTGIMVLDENGFFVDNFLWTENGLVYGEHVPFAFAGITVDPSTGDLYFVENAGQLTHVWVRLEDGPQAIVHGIAGSRILGPDTRCPRNGLFAAVSSYFSLTYRTVDGMLWTNAFNSGEMFTIDPLTRKETSMGTVPGITDAWGMGYDEERDLIYVYQEFPSTLWALDPNTLQPTVLNPDPGFVRELAFNKDDNFIYGVDSGNPGTLVRFDRDTGDRTEVGPTQYVSGIAYDPLAGKLVGIFQGTLYNIDPATGQAQVRAQLPSNSGWEGLAIIPAAEVVTSAEPTLANPSLVLSAYPNPVSSRSQLAFELPRAAHVRATVYDVAGRRVTDLHNGQLDAGQQMLFWNGRDRSGGRVASGTYYVELQTPWNRGSTKVTVLR